MGSCAYSVTTHDPTTKAPGATTTKVATKTKVVTTTKAATTATTVVATTSDQAASMARQSAPTAVLPLMAAGAVAFLA